MDETVGVLIADDDPTVRESLGELIDEEPGLELVAVARDADEAASLAFALQPDVALLDVRMPGGGGPSAAKRIRESAPGTVCLALSAYEDRGAVLEMLRAGAIGYLIKGSISIEDITGTISLAAKGRGSKLSPEAAAHIVEGLGGTVPRPYDESLLPERVTVMIADDDPSFLGALADLIAEEGSLELVGAAQDVDTGVKLACTYRPQVAVVDVRMPGGGGPKLAQAIKAASPETRVAALSMATDRSQVLEMLRSGATAYVLKDASNQEIVDTIRRTAAGQVSLSAEVTVGVIDEIVVQFERDEQEHEIEIRQRQRVERLLTGEGVSVVLQPIVDLTSGRTAGYEALARFDAKPWTTPDVWFMEAEAVGLRGELEMTAIRIAVTKLEGIPADCFLSMNISANVIVDEGVVGELAAMAGAGRIVIELSESSKAEDYDALAAVFRRLHDVGFRLAIDDVGAGVSLSHILNLAPDFIKLDIGLCRNVHNDEKRHALASAFADFSHKVKVAVIAEGIETPDEAACLKKMGVEYGQGFHLGRPA
jgi:DNA-binding NarL/FixJ family response regulator